MVFPVTFAPTLTVFAPSPVDVWMPKWLVPVTAAAVATDTLPACVAVTRMPLLPETAAPVLIVTEPPPEASTLMPPRTTEPDLIAVTGAPAIVVMAMLPVPVEAELMP